MKKTFLLFSTFVAILLFASSCTVHNRTTMGAPLEARVNFTTADLEYVGEVTGTSTQYYVLGIPYGGRRYYTASTGGLALPVSTDRGYNNALYDALGQKPDADFVLPISSESTINRSFLGSKVTITIRAKAFKIKTK
jgi:hypothetical protein